MQKREIVLNVIFGTVINNFLDTNILYIKI